jgi:cytochrome c551/c552
MVLIVSSSVHANPPEDGKLIFSSRCAACHNVNKVLVGPALAGVDQRHDTNWIIKFVQSSQSLVKNGDKEATTLFQKFNKIQMPDHSDLSADNIKNVVEYIKSQAVLSDTKAPFAKPTNLITMYRPLSITRDYVLLISYLAVVLLLIGILLLAVQLKSLQNQREKNLF